MQKSVLDWLGLADGTHLNFTGPSQWKLGGGTNNHQYIGERLMKALSCKFCDEIHVCGLSHSNIYKNTLIEDHIKLRAGEILFKSGDFIEHVYLLIEGQVILGGGNNKLTYIIDLIENGELIGDDIAITGLPSPITAMARVDCCLALIPISKFRNILDKNPQLSLKLMQVISKRTITTTTKIEDMTFLKGKKRIVSDLLYRLNNVQPESSTITIPFPKGVHATLLGFSFEHYSRLLSELIKEGLFSTRGRKFIIYSTNQLASYIDK